MATTPDHLGRQLGRPQERSTVSRRASSAQRRAWALDRSHLGAAMPVLASAYLLRGALDRDTLRKAVNAIVRRHDILRTCIVERNGEPVQLIVPSWNISIETLDLRSSDRRAQEMRIAESWALTPAEAFDIQHGPLLRCRLMILSNDRHILSIHAHPAIWDGWSDAVWQHDLTLFYEVMSNGAANGVPPLPLQYADYAEWTQSGARADQIERDVEYWKERLLGANWSCGVPADRTRAIVDGFNRATLATSLSTTSMDGVRALCDRYGLTVDMTLAAALGVVLRRYTGEPDILFGTAVPGRYVAALKSLIGCFANAVAIRLRIPPAATLEDVLVDARTALVDARTHGLAPFDQVMTAVSTDREDTAAPPFEVLLAHYGAPRIKTAATDLQIERLRHRGAMLGAALEIHTAECGSGLDVAWCYNAEAFDEWRIRQMARHFERVLRALSAESQLRVSDMSLDDDSDAQAAVMTWRSFRDELLPERAQTIVTARTLPELFEQQVDRTPDRVAMIQHDHSITFAALNAAANRVARSLIKRGAAPETVVLVGMDRSIEQVIAVLAVIKAGAAYLPVPPDYPPLRLAYIVEQSRPLLMLTAHSSRSLPVALPTLLVDDAAGGEASKTRNVDDAERPASLQSDHPACIIYTSGSSGSPKGVMCLHAGMVNRLAWHRTLQDDEHAGPALAKTALNFIDGSTELLGPLMSGGTVVLADHHAEKDPGKLAELVCREMVGSVTVTPSMLQVLLHEWEPRRTAACRSWVSSGELLSNALTERFERMFPSARLRNLYGMTEATGDSMWGTCRNGRTDQTNIVWNTHCVVVDERIALVPMGLNGEIYIGGDGLARGYCGDPRLTATRFVANPYGPAGSRLYRTGDVARRLPHGRLTLIGRRDNQVKIAGVRTDIAEVEQALSSLDGIAEAAVVTRDGVAGVLLVAHVVPSRAHPFDETDLRRRLRLLLAPQMIPATIVPHGVLPRTTTGKIDRHALSRDREAQRGSTRCDASPEETELCQIFAELFPIADIDVSTSFLELGGHSLQAMQLANRVRERLGVDVDVMAVLETPRISDLAASIARARTDSSAHSPL